ncbi:MULTISPECIES: helix-turn-helix domain-containing protein [Alistipes]|uniref:helix-turn-helix domain-containing protein n=1 Tax=Alistipes TaxID=239759 RepID=UPI0025807ACB|nr:MULTISPECIES: helix-turn-helix domain-containing protein [unclassified Alistipes]
MKVILAEKSRTNKWLSEQLGKDSAIVSKGGNTTQPNVEMLIQIAKCLEVKVDDLLRTE